MNISWDRLKRGASRGRCSPRPPHDFLPRIWSLIANHGFQTDVKRRRANRRFVCPLTPYLRWYANKFFHEPEEFYLQKQVQYFRCPKLYRIINLMNIIDCKKCSFHFAYVNGQVQCKFHKNLNSMATYQDGKGEIVVIACPRYDKE
jgi:hypothetical protein